MRCSVLVCLSLILSLFTPSIFSQTSSPVPYSRAWVAQKVASRPDTPESARAALPQVLTECDLDQCSHGVEAIWLFEGNRGEALWNSGPYGSLKVERFDGHTIVISRADAPGTKSSACCPGSDGYFRAVYTGTVDGDRIEGTFVSNGDLSHPGTWSARIQPRLCGTSQDCPLSSDQLTYLGLVAIGEGDLYRAAAQCWAVAADQGNAHAMGLLAGLAYLGKPNGLQPGDTFRLAKKSAAANNAVGMMVLGNLYEKGIGTAPDPNLARYWKQKGEALKDAQLYDLEVSAKVVPSKAPQMGAGLAGLLMQMILQGGQQPMETSGQMSDSDRERRDFEDWSRKEYQHRELEAAHPPSN